MAGIDETVTRRTKVLIGFMGEPAAAAYVGSETAADWPSVRTEWERAANARAGLPAETYAAPEIRDPPAEYEAAGLALIRRNPLFAQLVAAHQAEIKLVEIDPLLSFQTFVDAQFSAEGQRSGDDLDDPKSLIDRSFPLQNTEKIGGKVDAAGTSATVFALTRNLYVGPAQLATAQNGSPLVVFPIVLSPNWICVAEFGGRYYLKNGYHRTWLARHRGKQHVLAIVTRERSIADVGVGGPGFFDESVMSSSRPPRFADFFHAELAVELPMKSTITVLQFSAQRLVLPRMP